MSLANSSLLAEVKRSLDTLRSGNDAEKRNLIEAERSSLSQAQTTPNRSVLDTTAKTNVGATDGMMSGWSASPRRLLEPDDGPVAARGDFAGSDVPHPRHAHYGRVDAEDSNERERYRLDTAEAQLEKRREALVERQKKTNEQQEMVLELEASLVELRKEVEVQERSAGEKSRLQDARDVEVEKSEAELLARTLQLDDASRANADELDRLTEELEEAWRRIEDQSTQEEQRNTQEQQRLRRQVAELEARDATLRDRQRMLSEREHGLNARRRQVDGRKRLLEDIDGNAIERMKGELAEREALLQQSLTAAGMAAAAGGSLQNTPAARPPSLPLP